MVWFLVEVLLAVGVIGAAVWWTMSARRPDAPSADAPPPSPIPEPPDAER